jgi:glyoxylase-like metal-dependent hydrolase (beta-lactamase superfamily II)
LKETCRRFPERMTGKMLRIVTLDVCPDFGTNGYLLSGDGKGAVIIDPGTVPQVTVEALSARGWSLEGIWLTHGHFDHMGAVRELKERWTGAEVVCPAGEEEYLRRGLVNLSAFFGEPVTAGPADVYVSDGDVLDGPGFRAECMLVPGHTPGGACYLVGREDEGRPPALFSGDVLFAGSIGRTDFPGGDHETLVAGLIHRGGMARPPRGRRPGRGPRRTAFSRAHLPGRRDGGPGGGAWGGGRGA